MNSSLVNWALFDCFLTGFGVTILFSSIFGFATITSSSLIVRVSTILGLTGSSTGVGGNGGDGGPGCGGGGGGAGTTGGTGELGGNGLIIITCW